MCGKGCRSFWAINLHSISMNHLWKIKQICTWLHMVGNFCSENCKWFCCWPTFWLYQFASHQCAIYRWSNGTKSIQPWRLILMTNLICLLLFLLIFSNRINLNRKRNFINTAEILHLRFFFNCLSHFYIRFCRWLNDSQSSLNKLTATHKPIIIRQKKTC